MSQQPRPTAENRLLAALPRDEYERLAPRLEPVRLELSETLFRPGESLGYVFFPTTAVISLLTDLEDGGGLEVGVVGREGVAGVSAVLGAEESKVATAQQAGAALRARADDLREEFTRGGALQPLLLRYVHALMSQISQSVVCNVRHRIEARLARWLLMMHDRACSDELRLTHEFVANMLGIRRAGVSEAAERLKDARIIDYTRGAIRILDRPGLEGLACECYQTVKVEFDRLYAPPPLP
ncbi:MAG TPA: Crp/Fnr family transcriptional regulator [Pyrinomonadaceae bacterium]